MTPVRSCSRSSSACAGRRLRRRSTLTRSCASPQTVAKRASAYRHGKAGPKATAEMKGIAISAARFPR
eukprot:scaffold77054_cov62-Phaeocystis_antarctica.AAC.3